MSSTNIGVYVEVLVTHFKTYLINFYDLTIFTVILIANPRYGSINIYIEPYLAMGSILHWALSCSGWSLFIQVGYLLHGTYVVPRSVNYSVHITEQPLDFLRLQKCKRSPGFCFCWEQGSAVNLRTHRILGRPSPKTWGMQFYACCST